MDKPKKSVVFIVLLAISLLATLVCWLHWMNAVSLRGTIVIDEYRQTDGFKEKLTPIVNDPWIDRSVMHIDGALLRQDQLVGKVNVRVGLIEEALEGEVLSAKEAILLNTQMVRRSDLAQQYSCDDHCGFHAAVDIKYLEQGNVQYRVVLVDESDNEKRMISTGVTVTLIESGVAIGYETVPKEEARYAK